jgi:prefoldin subunit 5
MPDRQLLAEARELRAQLAEIRATMADIRGRQQEAASYWERLIATIRPV